MIGKPLWVPGFALCCVAAATAPGADTDLHRLWEDCCSECHGHAGLREEDVEFYASLLERVSDEVRRR